MNEYNLPLCRQDYLEIEKELLNIIQALKSKGSESNILIIRQEALLSILEESVKAYRKTNVQLVTDKE